MLAITVTPGTADSARLEEIPEPCARDGELLVEALALGICGTDREIVAGAYGQAPPGRDRLVLGHESLGRVLAAPADSDWGEEDLVVGIVRRPDPVPCACCAVGEWDMCRNGRYGERGIKALDGFAAERFTLEADCAVRLDPVLERVGMLLEPASIVAKAWEQIERIGARACFAAERLLVTGAGPIGLLAGLLGVQRGLELHVIDVVEEGPKPDLVRALGGVYHTGRVADTCPEADIVIEASGVASVVIDAMAHTGPNAITCLTGVSPVGRTVSVDAGALNHELVMENDVVFGSVNANRRHYEQAAAALSRADRDWLDAMITRRLPLDRWGEALDSRDDVKAVIEFPAASQ